ncbi:MAG: hypothetical protein ABH879_02820 [archaeon]
MAPDFETLLMGTYYRGPLAHGKRLNLPTSLTGRRETFITRIWREDGGTELGSYLPDMKSRISVGEVIDDPVVFGNGDQLEVMGRKLFDQMFGTSENCFDQIPEQPGVASPSLRPTDVKGRFTLPHGESFVFFYDATGDGSRFTMGTEALYMQVARETMKLSTDSSDRLDFFRRSYPVKRDRQGRVTLPRKTPLRGADQVALVPYGSRLEAMDAGTYYRLLQTNGGRRATESKRYKLEEHNRIYVGNRGFFEEGDHINLQLCRDALLLLGDDEVERPLGAMDPQQRLIFLASTYRLPSQPVRRERRFHIPNPILNQMNIGPGDYVTFAR